MKLILTIQGLDRLDNGLPARLDLAERGAIIGRSPTVSWCLPDPSNHISSRHCEVGFRDGVYVLTDTSTNGTFVNGRQLTAPHPLNTGDIVIIGPYQIHAEVEGQAASSVAAAAPASAPAQANSAWAAWDSPPPAASPALSAPASQGWTSPPPVQSGSDGWGPPPGPAPAKPAAPTGGGWGPAPAAAPPAPPPPSEWGPAHPSSGPTPWDVGAPPPPPPPPASAWSSAIPEVAPPPSADDVWGRFAENHVVDWARGGFGQPAPEIKPASDPLGLDKTNNFVQSLPPVEQKWAGHAPPEASAPAVPAPQPIPTAPSALDSFIRQLGLAPAELKSPPQETLGTAAVLLRRLIAGMVVMLEARARAKSQMGAQGTALSFDGNNPLKFARTPEQALAQLLNPPERGFMPAERAVEDAFVDLQSHQMATLRAMQGALKATLDRFSPAAIRERAEKKGIMAKIFPDARDAALWKAYEREFSGVVQGSDEAFMDVFAKEFRKAYEELTAKKGF